jgi:hypothetical protein
MQTLVFFNKSSRTRWKSSTTRRLRNAAIYDLTQDIIYCGFTAISGYWKVAFCRISEFVTVFGIPMRVSISFESSLFLQTGVAIMPFLIVDKVLLSRSIFEKIKQNLKIYYGLGNSAYEKIELLLIAF